MVVISSFGIHLYYKVPIIFEKNNYSTVVLDKNGEILRVFLNEKEDWKYPAIDEPIPEKLKIATILYEDKNFYKHIGIDMKSLLRAIMLNIKNMKKVSGASTITMQVSRLLEPKKRTYFNKIKEIIVSFIIEIRYSKDEILRYYLNNAPYGGNIIGYKTASLKYFNKLPDNLTWSEAALLSVLPNAPGLINPKKNHDQLIIKRNNLLKKLYEYSIISESEYKLSLREGVTNIVYNFDFYAPHFCEKVKRECKENIIYTTIEKQLQINIEKILYEYIEELKEIGINNGAVVVIENSSKNVISYIGSNNYWDKINGGMVDGVTAKRSSGSTLKPFLYALAIDKGLISLDSKLKDIPSYYGNFSPQNASREFQGMVTVREALINSLNTPIVNLLDEFDLLEFYNFFKEIKMDINDTYGHYGYSIILGGMEVNLLEISSLYTALANYGDYSKLKYIVDKEEKSKNIFSQGSSYLILDTLKDVSRPGDEFYWDKFINKDKISWKTGTSFGRRDGWAIGMTPKYTVAVWVGNFNGKGSYKLTGVESAGTLLFRIFNSLGNENIAEFTEPKGELKEIYVDEETGYFIDNSVENIEINKIKIKYPTQAKQLRVSPYYKYVYLDKTCEYEVCSKCWKHDKVFKKNLVYPVDIINFYQKNGIKFHKKFEHNPNCSTNYEQNSFNIIYPKNNSKILLPLNNENIRETLNIKTNFTIGKLFWFLNKELYIETINKSEINMALPLGENIITIMDSNGYKKTIKIKIIYN